MKLLGPCEVVYQVLDFRTLQKCKILFCKFTQEQREFKSKGEMVDQKEKEERFHGVEEGVQPSSN